MAKVAEYLDISAVRYFCIVQKQKRVADAMIEANSRHEKLRWREVLEGCRQALSRMLKAGQGQFTGFAQ